MNENHQRHLLVTFRHIDNLLSEAERILATAGSASPFAEFAQDSTPVQRKVIHDYIQRVREAMAHAMAELNLPRLNPVCGALWAARNHVTFAGIAVAEIEPKRMAGYGPLTEADCESLDRIVAELNAALDRLAAYLDKGPAADLQTQLQRLDQTRNEVQLLAELERVITAHGLVEFRGALAMLLNRLENGAFEVGIFGRVSSGKSSLLNYLLGAEVLPVGVTPITAIPTRVRFGHKPRALIDFADSRPLEIELSRLAEFSTELHNPGNTKHVARIVVEVPAARLREGVTFVDTPGLGSLATDGTEHTAAYLPQCDLGLVLVDAGSTLMTEDLALVQAIYQSGSRAMVLISKADLLKPDDRDRMLTYVKHQLATQLRVDVPVHLISVVGANAALCETWFEHALKPVLETHRDQAAESLRRKIGVLREAVVRALQARLDGQLRRAAFSSVHSAQPDAGAVKALGETDFWIETVEKEGIEIVGEISRLHESVFETAAAEIVVAWQAGHTAPQDSATAFGVALQTVLTDHTAKLMRLVEELRRKLEGALAAAHDAAASTNAAEPLPRASGLPLFDAATLIEQVRLNPPFAWRLLGARWLQRHIRARLKEQLTFKLAGLLDSYRLRVHKWLMQTLTELRAGFNDRAALLRPELETRAIGAGEETNGARLAADLERLRAWPH